MDLRTYAVTLMSETDLLMHWDNIEWADAMDLWKNDPKNKKFSKAGDDRTPAWRWIGAMYHDGEAVTIPQDNLMRCVMEGGALVLVPGGRSGKTFKAQTQSGMMVAEPHWRVRVNGKEIPFAPFRALVERETNFAAHQTLAKRHGFELFVKRAKIGASKHVRVRPMFRDWSVSGHIQVLDAQITTDVLQDVLTMAGIYKGLGEWRPGSKTPGPWGRFKATVQQVASVMAA